MHKLVPSLLTPKQLTRFSWPTRDPTFSPRVISHTYVVLARVELSRLENNATSQSIMLTLHSKSSYPAKSNRPETDVATEVMPQRIDSDYQLR